MTTNDTNDTIKEIWPVGRKPMVGLVVHFYAPGANINIPSAAIITGTNLTAREAQGICHLSILTPLALMFVQNVPQSLEPKPGHWCFVPRA